MTAMLSAPQEAKWSSSVLEFVSLNFILLFILFIYYFWCVCFCIFRQNSCPLGKDNIRLFIVDLSLKCRCLGSVNNKPFFNLFLILVQEVTGRYSHFFKCTLRGERERSFLKVDIDGCESRASFKTLPWNVLVPLSHHHCLSWLWPFPLSFSWFLSLVWTLLESGAYFSCWHLHIPLNVRPQGPSHPLLSGHPCWSSKTSMSSDVHLSK